MIVLNVWPFCLQFYRCLLILFRCQERAPEDTRTSVACKNTTAHNEIVVGIMRHGGNPPESLHSRV